MKYSILLVLFLLISCGERQFTSEIYEDFPSEIVEPTPKKWVDTMRIRIDPEFSESFVYNDYYLKISEDTFTLNAKLQTEETLFLYEEVSKTECYWDSTATRVKYLAHYPNSTLIPISTYYEIVFLLKKNKVAAFQITSETGQTYIYLNTSKEKDMECLLDPPGYTKRSEEFTNNE